MKLYHGQVGGATLTQPYVSRSCRLQPASSRLYPDRKPGFASNAHSRPEDAIRQACDDQGIRFQNASIDEDDEVWEDVQEEMEDFWMRSPKAQSEFELAEGAAAQARKENPPRHDPIEQETVTLSECENMHEEPHFLYIGSNETANDRDFVKLPARYSVMYKRIEEVNREAAWDLREHPLVVLTGAVSMILLRQAFTRLTKVYGLKNVKILEPRRAN